jgi:hypothetical protein
MDFSTTLPILAPKAPSFRFVSMDAVCGVSIVTGEKIGNPRLPRISLKLQVEVFSRIGTGHRWWANILATLT